MISKKLEMAEYRKIEMPSFSALKAMAKSPLHYSFGLSREFKPTPAMQLGTMVHELLLEPGTFQAKYFCLPTTEELGEKDTYFRTNAGKKFKQEYLADNAGKELVDRALMNQAKDIADSVFANSVCGPLLTGDGDNEVSLTGTIDGLEVKGRPDRIIKRGDWDCILDIKTVGGFRDAGPDSFSRVVWERKYYAQAGMYRELANQNGLDVQQCLYVAVDTSEPYACAAYDLSLPACEQGLDEVRGWVADLHVCLANDYWPGYSDKIMRLDLPRWAQTQLPEDDE